MTTGLVAEHISFAYAAEAILENAHARAVPGEVLGIVGPNGSGKSTLLRLMSGLLKPRSGSIRIDGDPLASLAIAQRARRIAFLPQTVAPAFSLTAFEAVCLGRFPHQSHIGGLSAHDKEVALRCMHATHTESLRDRGLASLSGGERQRVLLASVLAQEPRYLLLDEPTSALDLHHQIEIFVLLRRLAMEGYGIAIVTHDLTLAGRFCDALILLSASHPEIVASGRATVVLTEPLLSRAYGSEVHVCEHPLTRTPLVTVLHDGADR